jgi:hypothetical protein
MSVDGGSGLLFPGRRYFVSDPNRILNERSGLRFTRNACHS